MTRSALLLIVAILMFGFSASAAPLPTRLTAFEKAFRAAHDTKDMQRFDRLVCWDHTNADIQHYVRDQWRRDCRWSITGMRILLHEATAENDPNVAPQHTLLVWYAQFHAPSRYLIASRRGEYCLAVQRALYRHQTPVLFSHVRSNQSQRLRASGKPAKLALTATMRKLLIVLNSALKPDLSCA